MLNSRRDFLKQSVWIGGFSVLGLANLSWQNTRKRKIIVDADTANEVDDLFAIVRAVLEPSFQLEAITSAQWHTQERAPNDTVGASQKLNEDILRLMNRTHIPLPEGSNFPMVNTHRPQPSDAADFIIETARKCSTEKKLSVVILGPATNIASAVLLAPDIIPKLAVYYLGFWHHPETNTWSKREFNTNNDPNAVNLLLNTAGLEFHVMTASTSQHLVFQKSIVDQHLKGKGGIADYLVNRWENYDRFWQETDKDKQRWIMWDVAIIEALASPDLAVEQEFMSPHDNLARTIKAYTKIDAAQMEAKFWAYLDAIVVD